MNNNDRSNKPHGSAEDLERLLKNYETSKSKSKQRQKPKSNQKSQSNRKQNFNVSLVFDDDSAIPKKSPVKKNNYKHTNDDNAPRYKGEVYFSSHSNSNSNRNKQASYSNASNVSKNNNVSNKKVKGNPEKMKKRKKKKSTKKHIGLLLVISILLSAITMYWLNDIFAFKKDDKIKNVTIPNNAETGQIVGILHDNDLISNNWFCRLFMNVTLGLRDAKPEYISGVYSLRPNMGVEKMLMEMQPKRETKTVSVTFPEGWTIDKMAERLEKNGVCSKKSFYENLEQAAFEYGFVDKIKNKDDRYHNLEGYLFPAKYSFYVGDNPSVVIRKMLNKFDKVWTDEYDKKAKELGMSVDEVIILASMIQKEAGSKSQMKNISSVFHNRLEHSRDYPSLDSDATASYVTNCVRYGVESTQYDTYLLRYNTYNVTGLPVGAICNPGKDAIEAALNPNDTSYYYFCHDTETKEIYLAKTLQQHNINKKKADLS